MPQGYSIELYMDPALENQILKAWNVLARRQISTHLIEIESRPHITLFKTLTNPPPESLTLILKTLASKQDPLPLNFSVVGTLARDTSLLFLGPAPSVGLLGFQGAVCEALRREGVAVGEDFKTDSWVPYCAVAEGVANGRIGEGFGLLRELKLPVSGYGVDVGLVELDPVREVCSFALGDNVDA